MEYNVAGYEQKYQDNRNAYGCIRRPSSENAVPYTPQFEKEYPHKDIVQTHPQGVIQRKEPVTDEWENKIDTRAVALQPCRSRAKDPATRLLQEVDGNIGSKKAEQKPCWIVAIERTGRPNMIQFQWLNGVLILFHQEWQEREINGTTDESSRHVGNEQTACLVPAILKTRAQHRLVEVACLEEKEGHEIV